MNCKLKIPGTRQGLCSFPIPDTCVCIRVLFEPNNNLFNIFVVKIYIVHTYIHTLCSTYPMK